MAVQLGVLTSPIAVLDTVANSVQNSTAYALQPGTWQIAWQVIYATTPTSPTIQLQQSLDGGTTFHTVDTSTNTAGELRVFQTCGGIIRVRINAITGGSTTSVWLFAHK